MNVISATGSAAECAVDVVVVGVFADALLSGPLTRLDQAIGGQLSRLQAAEELTGKRYEVVTLPAVAGVAAKLVVLLGLGKREEFDAGVAFRAVGAAAKAISGKQRGKVAYFLGDQIASNMVVAAIAGAMNGCLGQDLYRTKKSRYPFEELQWHGADATTLTQGKIVGEAVSLARKLVNEPPCEIYPASFAEQAERVAKDVGLQCEVWDEKRLEQEKCGSLLAVARASDKPARLLILMHRGGKSGDAPLALVGKGVTFDSGGLSIKPNDGMKTMKCDMAGAAAVLAAMQAIAALKLPINVMGFCGLAENMLSGSSYKLGDVLTARSGKTIEVLNTDAEGRLVLADVLNVALDYKPSQIVDLATLTGACVVALGLDVAGSMSNNDAWQTKVLDAAKAAGEPCWPLPMFADYADNIRSEVADIKNTGDGRWGGAMAGGKFLEEFVDGTPWVHLDIAGPAFLDSPKPWQDAGGTGAFVRTLIELVQGIATGQAAQT